MTYDAWKTTEPDCDGPFCAICREIGVPLQVYLTEWWCEACIEQEEEYQHGEEYSQ
jgi:hypothetical protein